MAGKMKIKKGDKVIVIAGKDKGKTGEITKVLPKENKVVVASINVARKHQRPTSVSAGGIVSKELPIHASNVALLDPKENVATKIGYKVLAEGKTRYAKKSGEVLN